MVDLFNTWLAFIQAANLPLVTTLIIGVIVPGLILCTIFLANNKMWPFNGADAKRNFASDYDAVVKMRRVELEGIIRGGTLSLLNTLIYPYIRTYYLSKLQDTDKIQKFKLTQSASRIIKYTINELFYSAVDRNGFKRLVGAELSNYCWVKSNDIIDAVNDCCCRYIDENDFIMGSGIFNAEHKACKELRQAVFEVLNKQPDASDPKNVGLMQQIIIHESRTKEKTEELFTDPFLLYNFRKVKKDKS